MQKHLRAVAAATFAVLGLAAFAYASLASGAVDRGSVRPIEQTKALNARFASLTVAKKAGYGLLKDKNGIACIADTMPGMTMGAMGVHYASNALVGDGEIDYRTPEALVYAPAAGGKLQLAALEYVVLKAAWDAKHAQEPVLFGHKFNETYGGNRFGLPAFYSLHVWLYKSNPAGEFSMWNPRVHCGATR